ncbi:hypothetical protein MRX96_024300 [Rhipicephalus microplus]
MLTTLLRTVFMPLAKFLTPTRSSSPEARSAWRIRKVNHVVRAICLVSSHHHGCPTSRRGFPCSIRYRPVHVRRCIVANYRVERADLQYHRTDCECGRPIASGDTRAQSCLHAEFSRSRDGSRPGVFEDRSNSKFPRPPRSSDCQCSLLASGASRATTTTHLRLILKARALDSTFKPVIIVVAGVTVVLWRSERGRAAARRLQIRRFPILPNHDDTDVMRLRPPTARRYLGRSFALKLCQPIVILAYRKCCRRSRPWAKAPRAASSRSLSLLEATSKARRRPSPADTKAFFLGAWRGGSERHVISPFHIPDIIGVFQGLEGCMEE